MLHAVEVDPIACDARLLIAAGQDTRLAPYRIVKPRRLLDAASEIGDDLDKAWPGREIQPKAGTSDTRE